MNVNIILYEDRYQPVFKALNLEWLDRYGLTEQPDLDVLNNPTGTIIKHGGVIFLAKAGEEIVGSAAIMREHEGVYELAKMSVAEEYRSKGISRLLIERCIAEAKNNRAKKIILFSNHQLKAALSLYEKYGFQHVPVEDSPFLTADVKMELVL
jgi:GNAT superfamily N-acetyltransferase